MELDDQEKQETRDRLAGELFLVAQVRKYVLLRLDEELANDPGVVYGHPLITVEHVLPQSPAASSRGRTDFTDEERQHWTHRLVSSGEHTGTEGAMTSPTRRSS